MDGFLFEYPWHPKIVDTQILQIGNILIVAIPGEITTMAGRFVIQISNNLFILNQVILIATISNCNYFD